MPAGAPDGGETRPRGVGDAVRRVARSPALIWTLASVIAFVWSISMVGVGVALVDKGVSTWWLLVIVAIVGPGLLLLATARLLRPGSHRAAGRSERADRRDDVAPTTAATPSTPVDEDLGPPGGDLTDREREVLRLLGTGRTHSEIAKDLFVAPGTVKAHVNNIYRKLDARNRTEALAHARELRLVP
jgi:DNA-binding CsgD family transcriptional regulator